MRIEVLQVLILQVTESSWLPISLKRRNVLGLDLSSALLPWSASFLEILKSRRPVL